MELNWNHFSVSLMFGWNDDWPPVGEFWHVMVVQLEQQSTKPKTNTRVGNVDLPYLIIKIDQAFFFIQLRVLKKNPTDLQRLFYLLLTARLSKIISNHSDCVTNSPPLYTVELPGKKTKQTKKKNKVEWQGRGKGPYKCWFR